MRDEPRLAEHGAQGADGFVERPAGVIVGLLGPEHTDEVIAGAGVIGSEREVREQSEVGSPEYLAGCVRAADACGGSTEAG